MQIVLENRLHQRLKYYALRCNLSMLEAARTVFEHCLPDLPDEPANDNQADGEDKEAKP